ncbi:hypothetical protein D9M71_525810 [compost metagenome]
MNQQQIEFLRKLDPKQEWGTLVAILSEKNLDSQSFEGVLKHLLKNSLIERDTYSNENNKMARYLRKIGKYGEALGYE